MWPVARLVPHPDNPRTVNTKTQKFRDLVDSIRANGVLEPLAVRPFYADDNTEFRGALGIRFYEILRGNRRFAAAQEIGLETVPVRNLGALTDEEAYRMVAMGNEQEELTPIEEGKRIATALDKYAMEVKAVASMTGKTERWVVEHAQIHRGLSAEWKQEALEHQSLAHWTAGHWIVLARLPVALQAAYHKKL
jgi:ParB family chromosome partitioning protein